MMQLFESPHRRFNPLINEWVLVSPQRAKRPWQGQIEETPDESLPQYDPHCYLCPSNARVGGHKNPSYDGVFVFDNDFPALLPHSEESSNSDSEHPLFRAETERGLCRVICFSPRHDWTLAKMPLDTIVSVVDTWAEQTLDLSQHDWLTYVQVFENRGAMMGSSNPHPHGQIWATEHFPQEVQQEDNAQRAYFETHQKTLISAILEAEQAQQSRIVYQNEHFTIVVPFWAVWPFETLLMSHRPVQWLHQLNAAERLGLADALSNLTIRYDNLFKVSFPYSMGFHQAPVNSGEMPHWHLHAHFYPPLLRSATVRKFMVGYELLGTPQRDITAEGAAQRLRDLPAVRFSSTKE